MSGPYPSVAKSTPLQPLALRSLTLENNLLQAPLAGYSAAPMRELVWTLGRPGLLATEMISAKALALGAPQQERYLATSPQEGPVAFQIWGSDPDAAAVATERVCARAAALVDLNCGCPVRKVRAAGAGVSLMEDPRRVARIVEAMRSRTDRPLSVKLRAGLDARTFNAAEVARAAVGAGADLVTVHGRHAQETYARPCRLDAIEDVVAAVDLPVVGNGDVHDGASARRMLEVTGCAGIMVGRACLGAPWIFARIRSELAGELFQEPPAAEVGRIFLTHFDRLAALVGEGKALSQCRKLGSFYVKGRPGAKVFRERLNRCERRDELQSLVAEVFGRLGARA